MILNYDNQTKTIYINQSKYVERLLEKYEIMRTEEYPSSMDIFRLTNKKKYYNIQSKRNFYPELCR